MSNDRNRHGDAKPIQQDINPENRDGDSMEQLPPALDRWLRESRHEQPYIPFAAMRNTDDKGSTPYTPAEEESLIIGGSSETHGLSTEHTYKSAARKVPSGSFNQTLGGKLRKNIPKSYPTASLCDVLSATIPPSHVANRPQGLICELKTYEARYVASGQRRLLQVNKQKRGLDTNELERDHDSALILTRYYTFDKELDVTELEIRSPHMKAALQKVLIDYPGINPHANKLVIRDLPKCIFHYRKELQEYGKSLEDANAREHISFLLQYMISTLGKEIRSYADFRAAPPGSHSLEFCNLWMVFRPGDILYRQCFDSPTQCFMLKSMDKKRSSFIDRDGQNLGYCMMQTTIKPYNGYKRLEDLEIFPLEYHRDCEAIRESQVARGKKFVGLQGVNHRQYTGNAIQLFSPGKTGVFEDGRCFHLFLDFPSLTNCGAISVDAIEDVKYNSEAFESLLLPASQKEMILALVKAHADPRLTFDDVIVGKGRGFICLLHGAPGTGKTLTAESVADYTKRPLYTISSGELGAESTVVHANLCAALHLATTWNAIVLIDEADVFLEQRSQRDLKRNGLVSVFLRILEYYRGIMFLTTNRISSFDTAFKSRIHMSIKYYGLTPSSRRDLWMTFAKKASSLSNDSETLAWMDDQYLDMLGEKALNGREIKNLMQTAHAMAVSEGAPIGRKYVDKASKVQEELEHDFTEDGFPASHKRLRVE
ncbi:hypothetical protein CISG_07446 [Coccidioides immitis RMSCC 3703]|uniref:AAA+ ATPase domain-containing protein n=1 Tax=Coccidioides immitis RMSCC 3703 TaxID=454286 RepID=A0A0J8TWV0_COCIT|nr:hypothetical protein CISG_07446 [Coccidioides immitis RMSCC 3703]